MTMQLLDDLPGPAVGRPTELVHCGFRPGEGVYDGWLACFTPLGHNELLVLAPVGQGRAFRSSPLPAPPHQMPDRVPVPACTPAWAGVAAPPPFHGLEQGTTLGHCPGVPPGGSTPARADWAVGWLRV